MNRTLTLTLVAAVGLSASTVAAGPLVVGMHGELPCEGSDVDAALKVRQSLGEQLRGELGVSVSGESDGVHIVVGGRTRVVVVGDARGADAARLIAVTILDLASEPLEPPLAAEKNKTVALPAPIQRDEDEALMARWSLGLFTSVGTRDTGDLALQVSHAISSTIAITASVGVESAETASLPDSSSPSGTSSLSVAQRWLPIRFGAAWRFAALGQQWQTHVAALAVVSSASADVQGTTNTGVVFGATAALMWMPLAGRTGAFDFSVGAGVDGLATARDYHVNEMSVATTDRVSLWLGVGAAWRVGS